jgi:hypothetical protein
MRPLAQTGKAVLAWVFRLCRSAISEARKACGLADGGVGDGQAYG